MNHAVHPSPYDHECPTCTGMDELPDANEPARWASVLAAIGLVVLVVIALAAQGGNRP